MTAAALQKEKETISMYETAQNTIEKYQKMNAAQRIKNREEEKKTIKLNTFCVLFEVEF